MAPYFYNNNKVVPCRIQYYIHLYSTHLLHICLFHRGIFNQGRTQQLFVYIYKVTGVSWCLTYSQLINFFFCSRWGQLLWLLTRRLHFEWKEALNCGEDSIPKKNLHLDFGASRKVRKCPAAARVQEKILWYIV